MIRKKILKSTTLALICFITSLTVNLMTNNKAQAQFTTSPGIAVGALHSLALKSDGTVWTWGDNANGKLGIGTTTDSLVPVMVPGLQEIVAISASDDYSMALKSDGTVWAWGKNNSGQLGDGTKTTKKSPVQVQGLSSVIAIAQSDSTSFALKSDGTVWVWGNNNYWRMGIGENNSSFSTTSPVIIPTLNNIVQIRAGLKNGIALRSDGTVWTWGENDDGQLGYGTGGQSVKLATQVPNLSNVSSVAMGASAMIVLKNDGTLWHSGNCNLSGDSTCVSTRSVLTQIPSMTNVIKVDLGHTSAFAIKDDSSLWAWGNNNVGALGTGNGSGAYVRLPEQVVLSDLYTKLMGVTDVAGSLGHGMAIKNDGSIWSWGRNSSGQLGLGTKVTPYRYAIQTPGIIVFNQDIIDIGQTKNIEITQGTTKKFVFIPQVNGPVTITTGPWQTTADTVLNLYDGNNNLLATNDDYNNTTYSGISFNVIAGQTYIIEVHGFQLSSVNCTLSIY